VHSYILLWLVIGLVLLLVTLGSGWIARLPLSYALIYLTVGVLLGDEGFGIIDLRPDTEAIERFSEFVVIVSLFSCGLKIGRPLKLWAWKTPARLIGFLLPLTIGGIAALTHWLLGLPWGAGILLGAVLAPTDPVLASEVQLNPHESRDELRFGLTSEGGLNDAFGFPFVYFGLFWLEDSNWENWFARWVGIELVWAIIAAVLAGIFVARLVNWIDQRTQRYRPADELMEDFLALSLILLTYAIAELFEGYGFLAVFVAGLEYQRLCRLCMSRLSQLEFTEQVERLLEIGIILLLGSLLEWERVLQYGSEALIVAGLLFFIVRPVGVWISTIGSGFPPLPRLLLGWFGIRGVGSIFYLTYALGEGIENSLAEELTWITLMVVVLSILLHGMSATPLMGWYERSLKLEADENVQRDS